MSEALVKSNGVSTKDNATMAMQKAMKQNSMTGLKNSEMINFFDYVKPSIKNALPNHLTADRMIQIATTLVSRNPALMECTPDSLIGAVMQASILGLQPISVLGECYFVPYSNFKSGKKEIQFQIGYKGYLSLARRSNQIKNVFSAVVYKDDHFKFSYGLYPTLEHIPDTDKEQRDIDLMYAYAVVHYKDGGYNFVILSKKQIENLRMRSPNQKKGISGSWATDYAAMAMAKAIKQLSKYLPVSVDIQNAFASDEQIIKPELMKPDVGYLPEYAEYNEVITDTETETTANNDDLGYEGMEESEQA